VKRTILAEVTGSIGAVVCLLACGSSPAGGEAGAACNTLACTSGVTISGPTVLDFAAIKASLIEVCRDDECFSGSFEASVDPPEFGTGAVLTLPDYGDRPELRDVNQTPLVDIVVWQRVAPSLEVKWSPWSDADLRDGDRYRLTFVQPDGTRVEAIDETVSYSLHSLGQGECLQTCRYAELQL
jgi:hypothetical protein